ncbi:MEKHLA domain-containing protein [Moritella sp. 24]|uniref:MEKHLA domain-containing protein n=1 Tax=Moritella sp. 24 TaxID=2746230 RepID=UPI001BA625DE|nr:MEKHLA domain-containing protein [Moritella sp. 24]QUM76524.1 MEKHLA domain-containing protein [Moritella sp. 24]
MKQQPCSENGYLHEHADLLISSYQRLTGKKLIDNHGSNVAKALFEADFVVVSHGIESDPIFNYGNKSALTAFELNWLDFIALPSRKSAKPMDRHERQDLLSRVTQFGFIDDYRGLRISSTGRTFWIENATVWNLIDNNGAFRGQAAMFKP